MLDANAHAYRKKLRGWLSYAFASEVFVVVSMTLFLPICLEQFARDNGYLMPERKLPCVVLPHPHNGAAAKMVPSEDRCVVKIGWFWIDTASFSLYVYSISVALQALTVISMGGIADHPRHRKRTLLLFAYMGSLSATLFIFLSSTSPFWWCSALLAIFSNVGFGASIVAMNSYLPSLARDSPEVSEVLYRHRVQYQGPEHGQDDAELNDRDTDNPNAPLITPQPDSASDAHTQYSTTLRPGSLAKSEYEVTLSRATSRISSLGIALGYGAGITLLVLALIPVTLMHGSTFALRLAISLSGLWWMIFTVPAAIWLPGITWPSKSGSDGIESIDSAWEDTSLDGTDRTGAWNLWQEIVKAWKKLGSMLAWSEIVKLKNTFIYLGAWFLLSDGFTTITSTAVLFGKTVIQMPPSSLILVGTLTPVSGILGSLLWPRLQKHFGWSNRRVLVTLVVMASAVPAYGCLGFLVQGSGARFGGLTTPAEMFGLAVYFGSVYGAFQGYARAFYAELLPPGEEARWYALYSITDKSSSFFGPLIVGLISDLTGNIRYSFFFLVFMVWAAVPLLANVDVEKGRHDAVEYGKKAQDLS